MKKRLPNCFPKGDQENLAQYHFQQDWYIAAEHTVAAYPKVFHSAALMGTMKSQDLVASGCKDYADSSC